MLADQAVLAEIDRGNPAILVVDRAYLQGNLAAVAVPDLLGHGDAAWLAGIRLALILGRFILEQAGLAVFRAYLRQRILVDAGQLGQRQFFLAMRHKVKQPKRIRRRQVAADADALVFLFLVTRFGHVVLEFGDLAVVISLVAGDDKQVACIGRQRGALDLCLRAEIERCR